LQQELVAALRTLPADRIWKDRPKFAAELDKVLETKEIRVSSAVRKTILTALSERDETAQVCKDENGSPEPDPELRDTENVPLKEDIHAYFEREVKPHVPDAWIDEEKTRVGYEVPFTRHFYQYTPPRPLEVIEKEIRDLESEIMKALAAVGR
jgi:type I restriction enzyme M protein